MAENERSDSVAGAAGQTPAPASEAEREAQPDRRGPSQSVRESHKRLLMQSARVEPPPEPLSSPAATPPAGPGRTDHEYDSVTGLTDRPTGNREEASVRGDTALPADEALPSQAGQAVEAPAEQPVGAPAGSRGRASADRLGPGQTVRRESAGRLIERSVLAKLPSADQERLADDEGLPKQPSYLTPVLNLSLVLGLVIGLFAAAQAAVLYSQIALLPGWLRPLGYAFLAAVVLTLLYFGGKLAWWYLRLRVSPRLSLKLDADLKERETARRQVGEEKVAEARRTLTRFLDEYPLEPVDTRKRKQLSRQHTARLQRLGLKPTEVDTLQTVKRDLLRSGASIDDRAWLRRFEQEFLGPLDEAASRQTRRHMKSVFVFTAASPRGSLDTLAVLVVSYKLVGELCAIYYVRAGRWETAMMLLRVLVNLAAASQLDDVTDTAGSSIGDWLAGTVQTVSASLAGVAGQIFGKATEGGVNTLLLWRLSIRAQDYLRPIRKRDGDSTIA